jgi:hypothetical protein
MSIRLSQDNHHLWGAFTTSTVCKTVIIAVLTVMSGMGPHMISGTWDGRLVKSLVGLCQSGFTRLWVSHGETLWCDQDRYL